MGKRRCTPDSKLELIERTKEKMIEAADLFGIRSPEVYCLSCEIDELINEYMGEIS